MWQQLAHDQDLPLLIIFDEFQMATDDSGSDSGSGSVLARLRRRALPGKAALQALISSVSLIRLFRKT